MSRRLADGKDFLAAAPDSFGLIGQGWFLYYIPSGVSADNIRPFFHRISQCVQVSFDHLTFKISFMVVALDNFYAP
jgi:hypothetical protein